MAPAPRQLSKKSNIAATGSGTQQQAQTIPGPAIFLENTVIPTLQTIAEQHLAAFTRVTGLIYQCQYAPLFGGSMAPTAEQMLTGIPASGAGAGSPTPLPGQQPSAVVPQQGAVSATSGTVDKNSTIDQLIVAEMNQPQFKNGFTSQEMRAWLAQQHGQSRGKPINQNHVTNALGRHCKAGRIWAFGGDLTAKPTVQPERWYSPAAQLPAGAYTAPSQQGGVQSGQQLAAAS